MILKQISRKHILMMWGFSAVALVIFICFYLTNNADSKFEFTGDCSKPKVDTTNSTLELVHIVFRHGIRTPVDTYPNDPYFNYTFAPTGWGHITNQGKRELFQLGEWLHRRYGRHLEPYYSPDLVHAQATASPRAMMSLSTVLASLFAPRGTPTEFTGKLNWQPIPIFSEPLENDTLLLVRTPCKRYAEAFQEVLQLPQVREELEQAESLFKNLTKITGMNVTKAEDVNSLYITLLAEKEFGLKLPEWTKDYYPDKMQFMSEMSYIYNVYTPELQKIKGGPFLRKMFEEMQAKKNHTLRPSARKLFIYTAHDWTVGNILSALKVWQRQMPRFSIMAIFELHRNIVTGEYYVEMFLRNNEKGCAKPLKIPQCGFQCPLDKLIELNQDVIPYEPYEERCKPKNKDFVEPTPRPIDRIHT